jgi:hypothetical protein
MGGELTCQSLEKGTADSTLKSSTGGLRIGVGAIYTLYYLLMSVFLSCTKVLLDLIPN